MAANFWTSSHRQQLKEQDEVDKVHQLDKEKGLTLEEFKLIKIHMSNHISKLGERVKVQQRVVATAITYFRRVYTRGELVIATLSRTGYFPEQRKSMTEYDPRLVAPTCLYLAAKAEESTVQAKLIAFYLRKCPEPYVFEIKDILEMEMKLLEALEYYLVIYHPYRSLLQLLQDAGMQDLTIPSWSIVNDTYKMDLILCHPPYMIALACIYIASVLKDRDTNTWFEELRVDMNVIKNIAVEILDFYDVYKPTTEDRINAALSKLTAKS